MKILKTTLLLLLLSIGSSFGQDERNNAVTFSSETQLEASINEFASLFSKSQFKEAFQYVQPEGRIEKVLKEFEPMTDVIQSTYERPGSISISCVNFGDNIKRYGIVVMFHTTVITFWEISAYKDGETWMLMNLNGKAKSNPGQLLDEIPSYYYTNGEFQNQSVGQIPSTGGARD